MSKTFTHLKLLLVDLDDTLLHTSKLLVPAAHREAVLAMMAAGLPGVIEVNLALRFELSGTMPPDQLCQAQLAQMGLREHPAAAAIVEAGNRAYFDRDVGPIEMEDGVEAMLRHLVAHLDCVLVTSGVPRTQKQKVDGLGLHFLHEIVYVDVGGADLKYQAFAQQLEKRGLKPHEAVVVGDRPDSEIMAGAQLGTFTVRIARGEHTKRPAPVQADITIAHPTEIQGALEEIERRLSEGKRPAGI